ncbi:MAG: aspartate aminotransferase family protein [Bdellovibrionales bacterium]|nr:aspartate aminotransferase family protein [Bdellovibrionales bacterium]
MSPRDYFVTWSAQKNAATLPVKRAHGPFMVLEDGRELVDFVSTSYQTGFGHNEKRILDSIRRQMDEMCVVTPKAEFELKKSVSARLLKLLGLPGGKIFYTVSGAESVENALKIARDVTQRKIVCARVQSYHGASLGALSVTGDWRNPAHATVSDWTLRIPEPGADPDCSRTREVIEKAGPGKIAAVIVETITAANGVILAPQSWWDGLQNICRDHGILLINDEVADGFGRTGKAFAYQHYGVKPDMVCLAKAISGGYIPFGAVWVSDRLAAHYEEKTLVAGLTSYGHPLGLAALRGVLDLWDDPAFQTLYARNCATFTARMERLASLPNVAAIRVKGLFGGVDLRVPDPDLYAKLLKEGLFTFVKGNLLVLAPPLNIETKLLEKCMETVEKVLA